MAVAVIVIGSSVNNWGRDLNAMETDMTLMVNGDKGH